ncbi:MAG: pre-mRNA processing RNA-helicase [Chrysothrix sp. TS-e1954]|nr:MAG: pre-mRNA processing RNA-helicase [Chrysothrix sp. TS-e1954]
MVRGPRSPSPAGRSSYRSRRDEDRPRRRSRSPEKRYHDDRDYRRRRDDRREQELYRPPRRERSRDRRHGTSPRATERDRDRDYRRHSRERYRHREDSPDARYRSRRDEGRDGLSLKESKPASKPSEKNSAPPKPTEEELKRQRLAKAEAWRQKQAAKSQLNGDNGKQQVTTVVTGDASPKTPTTPAQNAHSPHVVSPEAPATIGSSAPPDHDPTSYGGKFDPKAIMKKATTSSKLKNAVALDAVNAPALAETEGKSTEATHPMTSKEQNTASNLKAKGNVSGFGLGGKAEPGKVSSKRAIDFEDDDNAHDKPKELIPTGSDNDEAVVPEDVDEDEGNEVDVEMADGEPQDTNEEAHTADLVQERQERMLHQTQPDPARSSTDVQMSNMTSQVQNFTSLAAEAEDEDPLDAFMTGLVEPSQKAKPKRTKLARHNELETFFGDEGEEDREAVGGLAHQEFLEQAAKARAKKKEIPKVNHSQMDYELIPSFYNPPAELTGLSEEALADIRLQYDSLKVNGLNVPAPIERWSQLALDMFTLRVIQEDLGYASPTPIQRQAIPIVLSGRDLLAIAPTGSGKTVAFLIPILRHIRVQPPLARGDGPQALIIAPTRELATQIYVAAKPFCKASGLRVVSLTGGQNLKDDIAELKRGNNNMVVATAGRLVDILSANSGRVMNLWSRCSYLVLDEADRMLDMGFLPQVQKIAGQIRPPPYRLTSLWSATFNKKMETLARELLSKPVEVIVGGRSTVKPEIKQVVEIFHGTSQEANRAKLHRLFHLLSEVHEGDSEAQTLLFVDRHEEADALMSQVMKHGYPCDSIHGGKTQEDRTQAITDFRNGVIPTLVATSVAARGLDIESIKLVVNMEPPRFLEDIVHRAGRCARKAGTTGTAVTFFTEDQDKFAPDTVKALRQSETAIPEDLQKLCDSFTEKVNSGKAKWASSGFGGRGLDRLNEDRDAAKTREKRAYRTGDEPEEEETKDEKDKDGKAPLESEITVQATAGELQQQEPPKQGILESLGLDSSIEVHKTEKQEKAKPADKGKKVSDAAERINARLRKTGDIRGNAPLNNKGPDAGAFHANLPINDLPQRGRWAVTNRSNTSKVLESTGVSITTKGSFVATGESPPDGTEKLTLLVEGETEISVRNAMQELIRLRNEAIIASAESEARAPTSGRYSVL